MMITCGGCGGEGQIGAGGTMNSGAWAREELCPDCLGSGVEEERDLPIAPWMWADHMEALAQDCQ